MYVDGFSLGDLARASVDGCGPLGADTTAAEDWDRLDRLERGAEARTHVPTALGHYADFDWESLIAEGLDAGAQVAASALAQSRPTGPGGFPQATPSGPGMLPQALPPGASAVPPLAPAPASSGTSTILILGLFALAAIVLLSPSKR